MTLHPYCAPAPGHAAWLTGALGFTIPPAWLCHAVPPLHKGGFSLPQGIQRTWGNHPAWPVVFTQAKTAPLCKGSCRRTPTEGLPACLADDAHTRRLVSSICLSAINPPRHGTGATTGAKWIEWATEHGFLQKKSHYAILRSGTTSNGRRLTP